MLVIEGEEKYGEEYLFIPLELPETILATSDGQIVELDVKDNSVLVPTEDGMVLVPIEDFCVVLIDGEIVLVAEGCGRGVRSQQLTNQFEKEKAQ